MSDLTRTATDLTASHADPNATTGGDTRPKVPPLNSADQTRVYDLAAECQAILNAGRTPDLGEVCREHPHLLLAVQSVLRASERVGAVAQAGEPPPRPAAAPSPHSRYAIGEEIARGGMGEVYRATDTVLNREVAVKVLQPRYAPASPTARRFDDEARVTAQLQHPGIPAVHDLGTLPDGRPFLAMKLIKGETLDKLLKDRDPAKPDLGRFVPVFEQICHALAYAHAHGVIHRDLKPANVMVGAFGETQVMDWGLAKVLASRERERPEEDTSQDPTEIKSLRDSDTQAGSVMGTPAFMAPEQAIGAVERIGRRTDVFGLGTILAVVLTGKPPYQGSSAETTRQLAALGKVGDCFARLDGCGAEPELVALCKRCLSPDPADRPMHAEKVAQAVAALRAAADERARKAEIEREKATVHAAERRKRRQMQVASTFIVFTLLTGIAVAVWWVVHLVQARERSESLHRAREEAHSRELARIEATDRLVALQSEVRVGRYRLSGRVNELRSAPADLTRLTEAAGGYGLPDDPHWRERPAVAVLPAGMQDELFAALSDACLLLARAALLAEGGGAEAAHAAERWNVLAGGIRPGHVPRAVYTQRADIAARLNRPDESLVMSRLAADTPLSTPEDHFLSGDELVAARRYADAAPLLREAVRLDPTHFWAQCQLGVCYHTLGRTSEARACYSAAVALRPDVAWAYFNRAMSTVQLGNYAEVIADLDVVIALEPDNAPARLHRGHARVMAGDRAKGMADLDAVLAAPDPGGMHVRAYLQRAKWKKAGGDAAGAATDTAAALPLTPTDEIGWLLRGLAQVDDDPAAALADIEQAVRLNPQYVTALRNQVHVLEKLERYEDAAEVMDRVISVAPNDWVLRASRGLLSARLSRFDKAVQDVTTALTKDRSTQVRYFALLVYVMSSGEKPELKPKALRLLADLLEDGYSVTGFSKDPDLIRLHQWSEFKALLAAQATPLEMLPPPRAEK